MNLQQAPKVAEAILQMLGCSVTLDNRHGVGMFSGGRLAPSLFFGLSSEIFVKL